VRRSFLAKKNEEFFQKSKGEIRQKNEEKRQEFLSFFSTETVEKFSFLIAKNMENVV